MKTVFELENLHVTFGQRAVLNIDRLNLPAHKLIAIIGPNGAGKSTLLKALLGQYPSQEWQCLGVSGKQMLRQGKIAWVGQHETFGSPLTVLDYVLLGRFPHLSWLSQPNDDDINLALKYLQTFELNQLAHQRLSHLSGGEQQRAALVRALLQQAPVLLLDEPSNHLDIRHQHLLMLQLKQLTQDGLSTVVVLHDLALAANYCDEVVLLKQGQVLQQGKPEQVLTAEHLLEAYQWPIQPQRHDGIWSFQSMPSR